ncbi:NAD(P)/FAD-dependent oxidoreductase [Candidatus Omnitrophota bacterium]
MTSTIDKKNILILGAGFGGLTVLSKLLRSLKKHDDILITLIDEQNFFLFSPLLHEVSAGVLLPESIVAPIRKMFSSRIHNFVQARVEEISLVDHKVITSSGVFNYDYLVLALGGVTDMSEMVNTEDSSNIFLLKTVQDAIAIKNHVMEMFERASVETDPNIVQQLMTFVISGGGYTGVELAASLSDVIHRYVATSYRQIDPKNIKIIVLESKDRIIRDLPEKYSLYIMKHLQSHKIDVMLNSKVTQIGNNWVEISASQIVASQTLVYVPGVVASPVISKINAEKDVMGRAVVNNHMELPGFTGTYAIGDCAHFQDSVTGAVARPRAHNAVRQAKITAKNLTANLLYKKQTEYHCSDSAEIISLGRSNALLRVNNFWFHGILAVLIWVMSYSLLAIGKKNRAKIAVDWLLSRIFGPDTTIIK